jgi:hypothetical protein
MPSPAFRGHYAGHRLSDDDLSHAQRMVARGGVGGRVRLRVGHFFFEHNRPATFSYPLYSFIGDWVMFKDLLTGKIKF